jgi:hypothetical protein
MEDFEIIRIGAPKPKEFVYELNPIEQILKNEKSLSLKQLKTKSSLPGKTIKYHIYTSKFIEDTNPVVHGSSKSKISVFNYTNLENSYFKRKLRNKKVEEQISI